MRVVMDVQHFPVEHLQTGIFGRRGRVSGHGPFRGKRRPVRATIADAAWPIATGGEANDRKGDNGRNHGCGTHAEPPLTLVGATVCGTDVGPVTMRVKRPAWCHHSRDLRNAACPAGVCPMSSSTLAI